MMTTGKDNNDGKDDNSKDDNNDGEDDNNDGGNGNSSGICFCWRGQGNIGCCSSPSVAWHLHTVRIIQICLGINLFWSKFYSYVFQV
jgi:hypothetical protein